MKDKIIINRQLKNTIFTYLAIILLITSISMYIYKYIEEKNSLTISATITSINSQNNKTTADVKYFVAEKKYVGKVTLSNNTELAVDDQTTIKVDMNNPSRQITNLLIYIASGILLLSLITGIIFIPQFIKNLKNQKRIRFLKQNGLYIEANIMSIYANNKGKTYKQKYPHRLRCQYHNPQDNKEYVFDSEDTFLDLDNIIAKYNTQKVTVFIDKTNISNYYVDLTSLVPKVNIINPLEFMKQTPSNKEK